jgi:hypothetical protein
MEPRDVMPLSEFATHRDKGANRLEAQAAMESNACCIWQRNASIRVAEALAHQVVDEVTVKGATDTSTVRARVNIGRDFD